jgi:hypothetical protein
MARGHPLDQAGHLWRGYALYFAQKIQAKNPKLSAYLVQRHIPELITPINTILKDVVE